MPGPPCNITSGVRLRRSPAADGSDTRFSWCPPYDGIETVKKKSLAQAKRQGLSRRLNVNRDPDAEYLTEGITESLINRLSQLPNVRESTVVEDREYVRVVETRRGLCF